MIVFLNAIKMFIIQHSQTLFHFAEKIFAILVFSNELINKFLIIIYETLLSLAQGQYLLLVPGIVKQLSNYLFVFLRNS